MDESLAVGGYAGYIFAAYGVTAVVVVGNMIAARRRFLRTTRRLRAQLARWAGRPGVHLQGGEQTRDGPTVGREA